MYCLQVKYWITFNEPKVIILAGYGGGGFPPRRHSPGIEVYQAAHNLIKSHAAAYHVYNRTQKGIVTVLLNLMHVHTIYRG